MFCAECSTKLDVALDMRDDKGKWGRCPYCNSEKYVWPQANATVELHGTAPDEITARHAEYMIDHFGVIELLACIRNAAWAKSDRLQKSWRSDPMGYAWERIGKLTDQAASVAIDSGFSIGQDPTNVTEHTHKGE